MVAAVMSPFYISFITARESMKTASVLTLCRGNVCFLSVSAVFHTGFTPVQGQAHSSLCVFVLEPVLTPNDSSTVILQQVAFFSSFLSHSDGQ